MSESIVRDKAYQFAIRVVNLYKYLTEEKHEYVMSKGVLEAGTAVGACVKEALQAESRADFFHEMYAALKKASRAEYWLQLLHETGYIDERAYESISADCLEVVKLLTAITKASKR